MSASAVKQFVLILGLGVAAGAFAASVGEVTHLSGTLGVKRLDGTSRLLSVKSEVQEGDLLTTEQETYARVKFVDGAEVVLRPSTQLKIENYSYNQAKPESDNVVLSMLRGGLRAVTGLLGKRSRERVMFNTATATIGIRGTHFGALFCQSDCANIPTTSGGPPENGLHVDVVDGAIVVSNRAGSQIIDAGKFGFVKDPNSPPVLTRGGVQVTMPQSISQNGASGRGIGKNEQTDCKP